MKGKHCIVNEREAKQLAMRRKLSTGRKKKVKQNKLSSNLPSVLNCHKYNVNLLFLTT